ncbi:MAG TPA: HutD family protein [Aestuariivirga sp.]|nr:HutD family protein [Aestuariivirga sp.]
MRKFTPADYRMMPWKNGGGTTTELYVEPGPEAAFLWRVSIAEVATDGPFSTFAGYDRHIMAIEGSGMVLDGGPKGPISVNPKFVPRRFSGDWLITSHLISGPVRDFNLMARRDMIESHLECIEVTAPFPSGGGDSEIIFAYLLEGRLEAGQELATGDSFLLIAGEAGTAVSRSSSPARLAVCRMKRRA